MGSISHIQQGAKMAQASNAEEGVQELLLGIPDHITIQHIATKLTWESRSAMQLVSRGWLRTVQDRHLYNVRVLSNLTEPFLVIFMLKDRSCELVITLYSCKRGSSVQLPPIPVEVRMWEKCIQAMCLDGRVYVWATYVPHRSNWEETCTCVLDLGGDKKWTVLERKRYQRFVYMQNGLGVLNGKIYRFRGTSQPRHTIERRLKIPDTQVYDPLSDGWSRIIPVPMPDFMQCFSFRWCDGGYSVSISKWASEQQAADPSKAFLTNGRYEPFFSEWKRWHSANCLAAAIDDRSRTTMVPQVYFVNFNVQPDAADDHFMEQLFFLRGRLLRFAAGFFRSREDDLIVGLDQYDTKKNTWKKNCIVLLGNFNATARECRVNAFASVNNVIWALVAIRDQVHLLRSSVLQIDEDEDNSVKMQSVEWIDGITLVES